MKITAVKDFLELSLAVLGTRGGEPPAAELTPVFGVHVLVVNWRTAEMVKYEGFCW
jgi:UDP-glucose 6-dehydrogenase